MNPTEKESILTVALMAGFADGVKLGEATAAPYAMTWTNAALGAYALQARVVDTQTVKIDF